jgi:hypothetical protein
MTACDPVAFPLPEFWVREPNLLRRNSKPLLPAAIDFGHPAANGLESWILFGPGNDALDIWQKRFIPVYPLAARGTPQRSKGEVCRGFGTTTDDYAYGDDFTVDFAYNGPRSCAFRMLIQGTATQDGILGTYANSGSQTTANYRVRLFSSNQIIWDYGNITDGQLVGIYGADVVRRWANIVCVSEGLGGSFKGIYVDGKLLSSANVSDGPPAGATAWFNNAFPIGKAVLGLATQHYAESLLSDFRSYKRLLSAEDVQALEDDWWGALVPA